MKSSNSVWQAFLTENIQWMIASLVLGFGIWIVATLQSNPIQQRTFTRSILIEYRLDADMIIQGEPSHETAQVVIRAPRSVWDVLRGDQIRVVADLRGQAEGEHRVKLVAQLAEDVRGQVIEVLPVEVTLTLARVASQRIPVRADVTQEPPSGYSYPPPTCSFTEVTARGPVDQLNGITAVARLNLRDDRNPVTDRLVNLFPVDENGRVVNDVVLEPSQITCQIDITQNANVFELSVVPNVEGFPPGGYIYEGFDFTPKTVLVSGRRSAIREMNGVIETESISLNGATSTFTRTVNLVLPEGVILEPDTQTISVSIQIGTIRGSRQYANIPVQIEGLAPGLRADILPNTVTVFIVGPQPLLQELNSEALSVTLNLVGFSAGSYQVDASASIVVESLQQLMTLDTTITVQPTEINVTIVPLATPTAAP